MSPQVAVPPPPLFRLSPPYDELTAVRDLTRLGHDDLPPGALLALGVDRAAQEWEAVSAWVPRLRARYPAVPLVLWIARPPSPDDLEWVRRAGGLHVRAVLFEGDAPRVRLARTLTEPVDLPEELEEWLTTRDPTLPPQAAHAVREIFRLAPGHTAVAALLAEMGRAARTVRGWLQRAGLPGPGRWLAVAHAVHAALRLQGDHHASLLTIAVECGYSDHSSLSRQSLRLFGVRPGAIRGTLGWEWLLDAWLRREAGAPVSHRAGSRRPAHRSRDIRRVLS